MAIFMTSAQAKEKISGLEARVTELETELVARDEQIETLQSENATQAETITSLTTEIESSAKEYERMSGELTTANASLKSANEKLETFDARVDQAAISKVSALGFQGKVPDHKEEAGKPDISEMKGLQKAIAAHKASKK